MSITREERQAERRAERLYERETIIRFDASTGDAILYTADPVQAKKWQTLGYAPQPIREKAGPPSGWECAVAKSVYGAPRRIKDGQIQKRKSSAKQLANLAPGGSPRGGS